MADTGHAMIIAELKKAKAAAESWGANYTPSNPDLALTAMQTTITAAENAIDEVQTQVTPYRNATAAADDAFETLSNLVSRIQKQAVAQGCPDSFLEDLKTPARKVKGQRATKVAGNGGGTPPDPGSPTPPTPPTSISASQMSRQQRVEHFDELISLLEGQGLYSPTENEFKVTTLQTLSTNLQTLVDDVANSYAQMQTAKGVRNDHLYHGSPSVLSTGRAFKAYVEAKWGRNSPEWNLIKGLTFNDYSKK